MTSGQGQAAASPALAAEEKPTRWRRRKEARPQEILDAALAVFAEKGFSAARMDMIAKRAGIAKGTIYLYFESKEAVFKALLREAIGSQISRMSQLAGAHRGPVGPLLAQILRNVASVLHTGKSFVLPKMVIAEAGNFPDLARIYREEVVERGMALIGGILREGIARGEFRDIAVEHAIRLVIAPIFVSALWRATFAPFDPKPYDHEALVEEHIATLLRGLAKEAS